MNTLDRRHDIDWLRVVSIGLLLIYHIALVFQPWGSFIQSERTSAAIWLPMSLFNVWRIPLLFLVSGMGVWFAMEKRNWKQLLLERTRRILLPLLFGSFCIVPIHTFILQKYYQQEVVYSPSLGHLWFLANIFSYVLFWFAVLYPLKESSEGSFFRALRRLLNRPICLYLFMIPFILEAELFNPDHFCTYVSNAHGYWIGAVAFFSGFLFVAIGEPFWNAVVRIKTASLLVALVLFLVRWRIFELNPPHYLSSIESMNWIFAILGFGYTTLNRPSKVLSYLSQAAYPIYIIHMIFLFLGAFIFLPLDLSLGTHFILINLFTFVGCFATYELFIRRIGFLRPLFGLKGREK